MSRAVLGQHFLVNKSKLSDIVEALDLKSGDTVLEIGPGHGELTDKIVLKFKNLKIEKFKIIAIEKDKNLADDLRNKIYDLGLDKNIDPVRSKTSKMSADLLKINRTSNGVEIIDGDALKILKSLILNLKSNYKIVGNIPYYITGYLLRVLGELENPEEKPRRKASFQRGRQASYGAGKPSLIVLVIQKEVAERICSESPRMNLLAASVQFWAEPEIVGYISKKDFQPPPEVDSAIIKLAIRVQPPATKENTEKYYQFIKILFKQPRKTIINNLRDAKIANTSECRERLLKIGISPDARPQDLSVGEIKKLSELF